MQSAKPLELLASARRDMRAIWLFSADQWGEAQADRYTAGIERSFQSIASMPGIGREHSDFVPPVRILPSAEHLIVYRVQSERIEVIRVLGARQNWRSVLSG